jgi:hypothetical protein
VNFGLGVILFQPYERNALNLHELFDRFTGIDSGA